MIPERTLGILFHYGVKGMKWGVHRSPEELGHVIIRDGCYRSIKGICVAVKKLSHFCLKPGAKHADEFFSVGYCEWDADTLFRDLENGFDLTKGVFRKSQNGTEEFSIPMWLGVTDKRLFTTAWRKDTPDSVPRFITAFIDRRLKEGKD